jgi:hypothetical protein
VDQWAAEWAEGENTMNHTLNYILLNQPGDFPLTLEQYISFAYFGQDADDLSDEELAYAAREFEEAILQLRGEE